MKRHVSLLLLVVITVMITAFPFAGHSVTKAHFGQTGPSLLKASIIVRANRLQRYWKAPDTDNYWSWMPEVSSFRKQYANTRYVIFS